MAGPPACGTIYGNACDPKNNSFANNEVAVSHQVLFPTPDRHSQNGPVVGSDMSFGAPAATPEANNQVGWNHYYSPGLGLARPYPPPCQP